MAQPNQNIYRSKKMMMFNNFLGGIAWGLGSTIGVAIVIALAGFILSKLDVIPVIGNFATQLTHYVQAH